MKIVNNGWIVCDGGSGSGGGGDDRLASDESLHTHITTTARALFVRKHENLFWPVFGILFAKCASTAATHKHIADIAVELFVANKSRNSNGVFPFIL